MSVNPKLLSVSKSKFRLGWEIELKSKLSRSELRLALQERLGSGSSKLFSIQEDCSLSARGAWTGWEIVTIPLPEAQSKALCSKILRWVASREDCKTDSQCGLHVNISFSRDSRTRKIDFFDLISAAPISRILELFGRERCKWALDPNFWRVEDLLLELSPDIGDIALGEDWAREAAESILRAAKSKARKTLRENPKASAVVDRRGNGRRYFEFRMMGNAGYEKRWADISRSVRSLQRAMEACAS